jgi:hypothetical protein
MRIFHMLAGTRRGDTLVLPVKVFEGIVCATGDFRAAIFRNPEPAVEIFPPRLSDLCSVTRPGAGTGSATRDCCRGTAPAIESGPVLVAGEAFARGGARVSAGFEGMLFVGL